MISKSRNIPITEYFTNLQLEWISYKVRELIYEREIDKKKFHDICEMKKEKIDQFAFRNCCGSIFSSVKIKEKYIKNFLGDGIGLLNFQYKDDRQRDITGFWDKVYYFKNGIEIEFNNNKYIIYKNIPKLEKVIVENTYEQFDYKDIKVDIFDLLINNIK